MFRAFALSVVLVLAGCCTDLQEDYIEANEKTHAAILLDVDAGLYTPDDKSQATLDSWKLSNEKARAALEVK